MTPCPLCDEPVVLGTDDIASMRINGLLAHRECALRSVIGGIGHLTAHDHWCLVMRDPDAGLTYRQSAIQVSEWVDANGLNAALAR